MLIEFTVENFLSFREKTTLSLISAKGGELKDSNTFDPKAPSSPTLLPSSVIYGANAAGKSNLIKALKNMQGLILLSARESQANEALPMTPFLLDNTSSRLASEFEASFISEGIRYQYGFAATKERITEEWLLAYPKGRPQRWIERTYDEKTQTYLWGAMHRLSGQKQVWQAATRDNALFLSTAMQLNSQQLKPVFTWFEKVLHVSGLGGWSHDYSIEQCKKAETKTAIVHFLKTADLDIEDIQLETEKFDSKMLPENMPDAIKKETEDKFRGKSVVVDIMTAHLLPNREKVLFDLNDESDGTRKIFALAGPWLDTLEHGYVLIIDELHDNLHPLMVKFLVSLFHNKKTNPLNAQLVFTTHDTSILNQEVFRRDQVWFCEKDEEKSSRLKPLSDFSPRKKTENLEKGYLSGRYGALPYLKEIKEAMGA